VGKDKGYHPGIVSLANTAEPLFLVNRRGHRPAQEQADVSLDTAFALVRRAGFLTTCVRGDCDFTQTPHLDRWDAAGDIRFLVGIDAQPTLKALAEALPARKDRVLERPPPYPIKTLPRDRPERVKAEIVRKRGYETIHLLEEMVAEFPDRPVACTKSSRVVVVRKRLGIDKGSVRVREQVRSFFSITNDRTTPADQIVFQANGRCNQENLIAQLKSRVKALTTPVDNLRPPDLRDFDVEPSWGFRLRRRSSRPVAARCRDRCTPPR
jgi:hypothetical protein